MDNNNNRFQDYSSPEPYNPDVQYGFATENSMSSNDSVNDAAQSDTFNGTASNDNFSNTASNTAFNNAAQNGTYGASDYRNDGTFQENSGYNQGNSGYNLNGQYYPGGGNAGAGYTNSSYGTMNNGAYSYGSGSYNAAARTVPLDRKGRPLHNRFGMKLTFSILGIIFSCFLLLGSAVYALIPLILSVLALIFACMQNKYYEEGKWDSFKGAARTSTVFLWIDFAVWMVLLILFFIGLTAILMLGKSKAEDLGMPDWDNPSSGYEYDYDDDRDTDGFDTDDSDLDDIYDDIDKDLKDVKINDLDGQHVPDMEGFNEFMLQGSQVILPMSVEAFYNAGFHMEKDYESKKIEPGHSDGFAYYDMNENYIGTMFIYNTGKRSIDAVDGIIGGITINESDEIDLRLIEGLSFKSSPADAVKVFGEDVSDYHTNEFYSYYSWYFEKGGYTTSIELDFEDDDLDEVWIMNYDELE